MSRCIRQGSCYKRALSSMRERDAARDFYESLGFAQHRQSFIVEP